jgi:argininosuccinate synthase
MDTKRILLAYSGGLDTTYCLVYLSKILGLEVHALTINTGGFEQQELNQLKTRALAAGAKSFTVLDVRNRYYESCIKYLIYGNVLKNGNYPLSVSSERTIQAIEIAVHAKENGFTAIAHGSTGAGNDQVRFDMLIAHVYPTAQIITPIRDLQLSRQEELDFLHVHGFHENFIKANYSINKGLWGTSIGGQETLQSHTHIPESAWPVAVTKEIPLELAIHFKNGEPIALNDQKFDHPVQLIIHLQQIAQGYGIGRDLHVGDTIIGIKGRVAFEAAAPILLIHAHRLLEKHVLTKWQLFWKQQLSEWYGNWMHEGHMLDPVMRDIEALLSSSQHNVTGTVYACLYPYRFVLNGIFSQHDLMNAKFGSYGEMNETWTAADVKGFTKIVGNQTSIYYNINSTPIEEN